MDNMDPKRNVNKWQVERMNKERKKFAGKKFALWWLITLNTLYTVGKKIIFTILR